jgi:hypothetical protein
VFLSSFSQQLVPVIGLAVETDQINEGRDRRRRVAGVEGALQLEQVEILLGRFAGLLRIGDRFVGPDDGVLAVLLQVIDLGDDRVGVGVGGVGIDELLAVVDRFRILL